MEDYLEPEDLGEEPQRPTPEELTKLLVSSQNRTYSQTSPSYRADRASLERWPNRAQRFLENGKVPNLHAQRVPNADSYPEWFEHVNECRRGLGEGFLYCFNGPRGTGKTQAAVSVGKQACVLAVRRNEQERRPLLYSATMEFFLSVKATFGKDDKCERDAIAPYLNCSLLILDEIQERGSTEWEDRLLNFVLDKRYSTQRDTILIANLTDADFAKNLGSSIVSRLTETGRVCTFNGPSFRTPTA